MLKAEEFIHFFKISAFGNGFVQHFSKQRQPCADVSFRLYFLSFLLCSCGIMPLLTSYFVHNDENFFVNASGQFPAHLIPYPIFMSCDRLIDGVSAIGDPSGGFI